jgi:large subunit ribosomal protein L10
VNRDQKAAVIDEVADRIEGSQAIFAIDYRGLSVKQAVELRQNLTEAGTHFQVVKNRLSIRAADKAGAEHLKSFLEGPTALAFVQGDAALAAKVIATFRRTNNLLEFKGGTLDGDVLTVDQIESIARLPAREVLHGQFVGVLASPITGLVRGLASMIGGLASQLQQIAEQGLVTGEAPAAAPAADAAPAEEPDAAADAPAETATEEAPAEETPSEDPAPESTPDEKEPAAAAAASEVVKADEPAEEPAADSSDAGASDDATPAEEAPGSPTAEAETAEQEEASGDAPAGGAQDQTSETSEEPSGAENQEQEG